MTQTAADRAYAAYMIHWIGKLDWPDLAIADLHWPQLRDYWQADAPADLDAIAQALWEWVDDNGGPSPSTERRMLRVRMLICLAAADNRQLEDVGYFEDLLRWYGLAPGEILRARLQFDIGDAPVPSAIPATSPASAPAPAAAAANPYQAAKWRVLAAFGALSFVSGAHPMVTMSAETGRGIELVLILAMAMLIFLWYRLDSDEHGYVRTPLLNVSVVMVAALAIPYYLIRSRGWQRGQVSVLRAIAVFMASVVLSATGASMFGHITPADTSAATTTEQSPESATPD